ncbi:hypothetical protein JCM19241_5206 [Vibrio ishigakensis]|uniref:Carboxymuconolactone decarboxylase-like domain-containing protein n=1 Tax=Vibrio ishigakensis TaxID=1481914 RepID=A0A0B8Q365_9VIBR|nr:hypothetical protein JCM19241_5206 [Vibrio ishigakensis]
MKTPAETNIDQIELLKKLLADSNENNANAIAYAAWAAALTTGSELVVKLVEETIGSLSESAMRDVKFAVARMGVTNPYFMARQFFPLPAGGTLAALNFRTFAEIKVNNALAYHHACVAISLINGGFMCLKDHASQLKNAGVSDSDIDATMRIAAAAHSLNLISKLPR